MTAPRPVPRTPPLFLDPAPTPDAHSPTLDLARRLIREGTLTPERFWTTIGRRTPVVEPDPSDPGRRIVTFLWRDADAAHVHIAINKVTTGPHAGAMERVSGSDIWFRTVRLDSRWRGSYEITPCDAGRHAEVLRMEPREAIAWLRRHAVHDSLNPLVETAREGRIISVAELDDAPPQPWIRRPAGPLPGARSMQGPRGRRLWVADEPARDTDDSPLVLVLDGEMWVGRGHVSASATSLAAAGLVQPPVIVYIDNGDLTDRVPDLSVDSHIDTEIAHEIIPWIRERFPVSGEPDDVTVLGQSLGGLAALKTAFDHPDVVGNAIAQSSSLWQHDMLDRAAAADPARTRLWIEVGLNEPVLLEPHRRLRDTLHRSGVPLAYGEFVGGHDPVCWRGGIGEGLRTLLPAPGACSATRISAARAPCPPRPRAPGSTESSPASADRG